MAWRVQEDCAFGSSVPAQVFQDSNTVVTVVGQQLKFSPCGALGDPSVTKLMAAHTGHGIGVVATCAKTKQFAYAERRLQPQICVCSYPDLQQLFSLDGAAEVELVALAFSRDGSRLISLSGAPDLRLSVWELKSRQMLCQEKVPAACSAASFNPRSSSTLCVHAPSCLQLWTVKQSYQHFSLKAKEVQPVEEVGTGGLWGCHCWGVEDELYAGTDTGAVIHSSLVHEPTLALAAESAVSGLVAEASHLVIACRDGSLTWCAPRHSLGPAARTKLLPPPSRCLPFARTGTPRRASRLCSSCACPRP